MALLIVGTHTPRTILTIGSFSNVVILNSPKREQGGVLLEWVKQGLFVIQFLYLVRTKYVRYLMSTIIFQLGVFFKCEGVYLSPLTLSVGNSGLNLLLFSLPMIVAGS